MILDDEINVWELVDCAEFRPTMDKAHIVDMC